MPKTLPCGTPDTTLTSLHLQPTTITCCHRSERNYVNIDNTEPQIPTEQSLYRIPRWMILSKAALKSICTILVSCPLSNALCSVCDTHKSASQVPKHFFSAANWVVGSTPLRSINRPRRTDTRRSNKLDNTDVLLLLLLLLLKKVGSARLRESDVHPISPKTPTHNINL